MTSTYGTIPTSTSPSDSASGDYLTRATDRIQAGLGARRPWKLMFDVNSLNFPKPLSDAPTRLRHNAAYFRMNYAVVVLVILFLSLSLLWHPVSLVVLVVMLAAWTFLYFLRDVPLVVFGHTVDDRVVLGVLGAVTIVMLFLTSATVNILVALLIAVVAVAAHAVLRKTEDLHVDQENEGLVTSA